MVFRIYRYRNKINGKSYIGQTITGLKERAKYDGSGYSDSPKFWKAIQKYGWASFEGTILHECSTLEDANYYEQYYIKKYNTMKNGYNLSSGGRTNFSFSDETKQKISEISKKTYNHAKHDIPVYQFDIINNTLIQRYNSAAEAARSINGNKAHITACCKGKRKTHAGYVWSYSQKCPEIKKKIYQYDAITRKLVRIWNDISEISNDAAYKNRVSNVCNHYQRTHAGYVWSYTNLSQNEINLIIKKNNKPLIVKHKDKTYASIREASKAEKISNNKILHMCIEKIDGWRAEK